MPVFKRNEGGITYYSTKETKPPKAQLDALKKLQSVISQSEFEDMKSRLMGDEVDETVSTLKDLQTVADAVNFLGPKFQQSKDAREELARALLNEGEDEDEVKLAAGVSWNVLASWCYAKTETGKKTDKPLVPRKALTYIEKQAEKVAAENASNS